MNTSGSIGVGIALLLATSACSGTAPESREDVGPNSGGRVASQKEALLGRVTVPWLARVNIRGEGISFASDCPGFVKSMSGKGNAVGFGRYDLSSTFCLAPDTGQLSNVRFVCTFHDGDTLEGTGSGWAVPVPGNNGEPPTIGNFDVSLDIVLVGGTGRFLDATGHAEEIARTRVELTQPGYPETLVGSIKGEVNIPFPPWH